jgi:hypothetical protein
VDGAAFGDFVEVLALLLGEGAFDVDLGADPAEHAGVLFGLGAVLGVDTVVRCSSSPLWSAYIRSVMLVHEPRAGEQELVRVRPGVRAPADAGSSAVSNTDRR